MTTVYPLTKVLVKIIPINDVAGMRYILFLLASSLCAVEIQLGHSVIDVEIADTAELRKKGLSGRSAIPDGTGMLFVFETPQICSFWMKDTKVPLSVGFFDEDKKLVQRIDMYPPEKSKELTVYRSNKPVQYALEVPMGWFRKNRIHPGETFQWIEAPVQK